MVGARIFVALCFVVLGASFVASTALLIYEFQGIDWLTMVVAHSHLFFFFPVLGILALFAFYLPSVVFTHLYWTPPALRQTPLPDRPRGGGRGLLRLRAIPRQAAARHLGGLASCARSRQGRAGQGSHPRRAEGSAQRGTEPCRHLELRAQLRARSAHGGARRVLEGALLLPGEGSSQGCRMLPGAEALRAKRGASAG